MLDVIVFMLLQLDCNSTPRPAFKTDVVVDPAPTNYSGPYCAEGETCTIPDDWELEGEKEIKYNIVGELRAVQDEFGVWDSEEFVYVNTGILNKCWEQKWVLIPRPLHQILDISNYTKVNIDPEAFDGEKE